MSFVHPLLLGGLLLVGIPVLIHLIMRQKPKRLPFPAFRFLVQKHRTNQRRLRLRHLLLLGLRILLVAIVCLALARPKLFSDRLHIGSDRPAAAILVFDTSMSMGYEVSKQTRLDDAKKRALELLDELPADSRVAVLDSAEPGGEWLPSLAKAREQITTLKLRPVNAPVTRQIGQAYRLLNALDQGQDDSSEPMPRFLYVFSDRTTACWDASEVKGLQQPEGLNALFVDVGVDAPIDFGIVGVEVPRQVVHPGDRAEIRATVRAVGADVESDVTALREKEKAGIQQLVKLAAGNSEIKVFERAAADAGEADDASGKLPTGFHQFEIQLGNNDALPFNNVAYATFKIQEGRRILLVTDRPGKSDDDSVMWARALSASHQFPWTVLSTEKAAQLSNNDLDQYEAVCLLEVADPKALWERLTPFVEGGKGLAVVLGGEDWLPSKDGYDSLEGRKLLGVKFLGDAVNRGNNAGDKWRELQPEWSKTSLHPLVSFFREAADKGIGVHFTDDSLPQARFYWKVQPQGATRPLASFADEHNESWPALLEHRLGKGRVLLLTSPMDARLVKKLPPNNYFASRAWFGMGLALFSTGYLAGDAETPTFNFICGQAISVPVPASQTSLYVVIGPSLRGVDVPRAKGENALRIPQAVSPGNYTVFDPTASMEKPVAGFSLNIAPEESQLDRVPTEQIEALLGPSSILTIERGDSLTSALQGHWLEPVELFPWLMIFVLLLLAVENLLANKFYRRGTQEQQEAPTYLAPRKREEQAVAGSVP
jgi:hypothetical protein